MRRNTYCGIVDFMPAQEEFERAMWCPESEREIDSLLRKVGSMESELHHLRNFCWLEHDRYAKRIALRLDFDTTMLGMMAGNMDEVVKFVGHRVAHEIQNMYRAK